MSSMKKFPEKHRSKWSIFFRAQNACTGAIYIGYTLSEMCLAMTHLMTNYGLTIFGDDNSQADIGRDMQLLLGPILVVAAIITTYFLPKFMHRLERRQFMIISDCIFLVATAFTQIPVWYCFSIARLLMGVSCGLDSESVPMYIRETSPETLIARMGSLFQANVSFGIVVGFIVTLPLDDIVVNEQPINQYWRFVFLFPIIFSIQRLIGLLTIYKLDTPFYYYRNGDKQRGRQALEEIYVGSSVDEMEKQFFNQTTVDIADDQQLLTDSDLKKQLLTGSGIGDEMQSYDLNGITAAQKHSFNNRLRVGVVVNFLQQGAGNTALAAVAPAVASEIFSDSVTAKCLIVGSYIFLFFVSTLGVAFNRKLARKKYLVFGFLICGICQFALAGLCYDDDSLLENTTHKFIFILFMFAFFATYSLTIGPVTPILTSDILKDRGVSYSMVSNQIATLGSIALLILNGNFYINHIIFGSLSLLGSLFSQAFVIETNWLKFNQILLLYCDKKDILKEKNENLSSLSEDSQKNKQRS